MGSLSLEKVDHLLWLGRYVERSLTTLRFIVVTYDAALDSTQGNWKGQLEELGFDQDNDNPREFFDDCLFGHENVTSVYSSLSAALDNAMVVREVIGTESLAYVQMALNEIERAEHSDTPLLDLQQVTDCIMAFKGCCDDYIANEAARNVVKCGISAERMDLYARLNYHLEDLQKETHKLASRIDRTGMLYSRSAFKALVEMVFAPDFPKNVTYEDLGEILSLIAKLF